MNPASQSVLLSTRTLDKGKQFVAESRIHRLYMYSMDCYLKNKLAIPCVGIYAECMRIHGMDYEGLSLLHVGGCFGLTERDKPLRELE